MNNQDQHKEGDQPSVDQESFAYQLLLLQQRLVAYEQLHLEEIAELRQEIERLRRVFLQETHPQLRAIAPLLFMLSPLYYRPLHRRCWTQSHRLRH
jgi:hypothetical protein